MDTQCNLKMKLSQSNSGNFNPRRTLISTTLKALLLACNKAPRYEGEMMPLEYDAETSLHPHDVCIDNNENIDVSQWYIGRIYSVILERI